MTISKKMDGDKMVMALEDRLDTTTAPQLDNEFKVCLYEVKELVLDLDKLESLSSAGLRVLLAAQKRAAPGMDINLKGYESFHQSVLAFLILFHDPLKGLALNEAGYNCPFPIDPGQFQNLRDVEARFLDARLIKRLVQHIRFGIARAEHFDAFIAVAKHGLRVPNRDYSIQFHSPTPYRPQPTQLHCICWILGENRRITTELLPVILELWEKWLCFTCFRKKASIFPSSIWIAEWKSMVKIRIQKVILPVARTVMPGAAVVDVRHLFWRR